MSDNNNAILAVACVAGYLYMKRNQAPQQMPMQYAPQPMPSASMPGNVGNGWQQVATGAVAGFLGQLMNGPRNNTSTQYAPSYLDTLYRGDIVQDAVQNVDLPVDIPFLDWF